MLDYVSRQLCMQSSLIFLASLVLAFHGLSTPAVRAAQNVMLSEVPDYAWHAGCFGTAAGNLVGFWDRHGFPDFYTGPTASGLAPLNSDGPNSGIRSLWASKAGFDGRPADQLGHIDDYWQVYDDELTLSYESTAPDPYLTAGRPEHPHDCLSDFMGASQNKWKNINGEHDGNIDAYAFVIWDPSGARRTNFQPPPQDTVPVLDIPSGLRSWTRFKKHDAEVFSQLTDFNPKVPANAGFTFENLKAEIDAGYPVLLYLQNFNDASRALPGMARANPNVHGMLAFGYLITDNGAKYVRYRTSWGGSGDHRLRPWTADAWEAFLPVRGVIGYHPLPRIQSITSNRNQLTVKWHGPSASLFDVIQRTSTPLHKYVIEKSTPENPYDFIPVSEPTSELEATFPSGNHSTAFFRIRLLTPSTGN